MVKTVFIFIDNEINEAFKQNSMTSSDLKTEVNFCWRAVPRIDGTLQAEVKLPTDDALINYVIAEDFSKCTFVGGYHDKNLSIGELIQEQNPQIKIVYQG